MNYGDMYLLGQHILMCGDATNSECVDKLINGEKINLVLTDPPYGMKCQSKDGTIGSSKSMNTKDFLPDKKRGNIVQAKKYPIMQGDNSQESARKFYEIIKNKSDTQIFWGGQYFANFLPVNGGWLFWDKLTGANDFSDGELAWVSKGKRVRKYTQRWAGIILQGSAKLNGLGGKNKTDTRTRIHPTQKPVELHMVILSDFTSEWDVVLDCFGGSGTTLIACEMTGRKCLMMEISPEYCELICERFEKLTGIQREKIN